MTLKQGDGLVLLDDVNRDSVEHEFTEIYEIIEPPSFYPAVLGVHEAWITVRLRKVE